MSVVDHVPDGVVQVETVDQESDLHGVLPYDSAARKTSQPVTRGGGDALTPTGKPREGHRPDQW